MANLTDRELKAHDLFKQGYNCAQAVLLAFEDYFVGYDRDTLIKMSSAFGGGFAGTRNVCGAISALGMIVGLCHRYTGDITTDKAAIYRQTQDLIEQFTAQNKSIICSELLANIKGITYGYQPAERTAEYYNKRPCLKFVMDAARIANEYILSM